MATKQRDTKPVELVYVGPMSAFSCDEIGIQNQPKGETFTCPKWFADEKLQLEPERWQSPKKEAAPAAKKKGGD